MCTSSTTRIVLLVLGALLLLTAVKTSVLDATFVGRPDGSLDEVVLDRTFTVQAGQQLMLNISHSDVHIEPGQGNEARVQVTLNGRDMDRARQFFEHLNFEVGHSGGTLTVRTNPRSGWNGSTGDADVNVLISLPEVFDADLDVSHGDIEVESLKGRLDLNIAHGDLDVGTLGGTTLTLDMAHGDIQADRLMSEKIRMNIQHGNLSVDRLVAVETDISTAHGDVEIDELEGYPRIAVEHGDIDVRLVDLRGGEFRTAHGDVDLAAPSAAAADVEFEASDVDVASEFQFEGTRRDDTFRGRINGGGPPLRIQSTHGDVTFRAR